MTALDTFNIFIWASIELPIQAILVINNHEERKINILPYIEAGRWWMGINGNWKQDWLLYKYLNKQKVRWVFRINYSTQGKYEHYGADFMSWGTMLESMQY